ncbi:MAG: inorganic diphosphatase [Candidatus Nomurabacteria bacterium]|nr:inorganic diphosphatase [Candidatus Nomurabacteria bacterium]
MANINQKPSKFMYNLLHVLPAFADESKNVINVIVEVSAGSINKYEIITESGQLKLDRVGYSSLSYPFTYGAIPMTWDYDGDPLDVEIVNITEPLVPGSLVEARVIGVMKFVDGGEVDDKIIAVLNDDRRSDHIKHVDDLGEYFKTQTKYFWENIKFLKKPGTGVVETFYGPDEAMKVLKECEEKYKNEYAPKLE